MREVQKKCRRLETPFREAGGLLRPGAILRLWGDREKEVRKRP